MLKTKQLVKNNKLIGWYTFNKHIDAIFDGLPKDYYGFVTSILVGLSHTHQYLKCGLIHGIRRLKKIRGTWCFDDIVTDIGTYAIDINVRYVARLVT